VGILLHTFEAILQLLGKAVGFPLGPVEELAFPRVRKIQELS
jgi:hypothetical protein